jgi:hypothetical protein
MEGTLLVEYRRTGGFAGEESTLSIRSDGTVDLHQSISGRPVFDLAAGTLSHSTFEQLTAALNATELSTLQREYPSGEEILDGITYTIRVFKQGQAQTVVFQTRVEPLREMKPIQDMLERIIRELTAKNAI